MTLPTNPHEAAQLLDKIRPTWFNEIDLSRLDNTSNENCILGQLYGVYWKGLQELFPNLYNGKEIKETERETTVKLFFNVFCGSKQGKWVYEIEDRRGNPL